MDVLFIEAKNVVIDIVRLHDLEIREENEAKEHVQLGKIIV